MKFNVYDFSDTAKCGWCGDIIVRVLDPRFEYEKYIWVHKDSRSITCEHENEICCAQPEKELN